MKLWNKGVTLAKEIEQFTIGKDRDLDLILAQYDVLGSIAHARMLQSVGLLDQKELKALHNELKIIYQQIKAGSFQIDAGVEDIHSQIELLLTERLGEVGKKIHTGRSRNDQVLLDIKLYVRSEIKNLVLKVQHFFEQLLSLSESHKEILMPGYTHLQIAMPSSIGLWFAAYAESLVDDLIVMLAVYRIVNKNPLGSAAGYGSSLPLNRQLTAQLLGFETLNFNVMYAQMTRGKIEKLVSTAIASIAATLAKMCMDICLFTGQNFAFFSFPEQYTTGSSIMPHKNNPDVFELIRAKCNRLQALPNEIQLILTNLPSGYHRDFQLLKENFFVVFKELTSCIDMMIYMLKDIQINKTILNDPKYKYIKSVEAVNQLVMQGIPFRNAYQKIAQNIKNGEYQTPLDIQYTHEGSIGNLSNDKIQEEMKNVIKQFDFDKAEIALSRLLE